MTDEDSLKIRKLELEIEDLETKLSWHQRILAFLPIFTVIFAVCGLWYNFYVFSKSQEKQSESEAQSRLDDFRKPFYQKRLDLYVKAVETVSAIANSPIDSVERKKAEMEFAQLYTGTLHIVADEQFSKAKIEFYNCLIGNFPDECKSESSKQTALQEFSLALAESAKWSIFQSWKIESEY